MKTTNDDAQANRIRSLVEHWARQPCDEGTARARDITCHEATPNDPDRWCAPCQARFALR